HESSSDDARARAVEKADDRKRRERVDGARTKADAGRFQQALRAPGPALPSSPGAGMSGKAPSTGTSEHAAKPSPAAPGQGPPAVPASAPGAPPPGKPGVALDERLARLARLQAKQGDALITLQPVPPHVAAASDKGEAGKP